MIRKHILRAHEHSETTQTSEPKLTFKITYYPVFQNISNILQELHLLSFPGKKHKKVFSKVPVIEFRNGKSLKDYLVRAVLPQTNKTERCEPSGQKTCLVCDSIRSSKTITTKVCRENLKILSGPLNCNSEKVLWKVVWNVWWGSLCWKRQN